MIKKLLVITSVIGLVVLLSFMLKADISSWWSCYAECIKGQSYDPTSSGYCTEQCKGK